MGYVRLPQPVTVPVPKPVAAVKLGKVPMPAPLKTVAVGPRAPQAVHIHIHMPTLGSRKVPY